MDEIPKAEEIIKKAQAYKPNALVANLPEYLKDPANYEKIRRQIYETIVSNCGHADLGEMAVCKICSDKMLERRRLLKKLGFKNPAQYFAWQKTHEKIKETFPLVDWQKQKFVLNKNLK